MKTTLTKLLRAGLVIVSLALLSSCGLKGPLVLEQQPVEKTQAPLENSIDQAPVETEVEVSDTTTEAASEPK